jgi:membrane fusion protein (multidrug efflux system)
MSLLKYLAMPLLLGLAACGGSEKSAPPGGSGGMPPAEVEVMTVQPGRVTVTRDLPGRVQAFRTAQVRARVDGVVEHRLFREGSDVKAGDTLFQIDAQVYRAAVDAARAEVNVSRQTLARYQPLLEIKAVSQQEYDLAVAKAKQALAALALAQEDLDNASVPAPIAGHIGRAMVTEGALVKKSEANLLATIEQIDQVYVNFTQSGSEVLQLRRALTEGKLQRSESLDVQLLLEDGSVYALPGRLFFTDMAVDPETGAVSLRAQFANPKRELLPGMFVRIRFPEAVTENAIRVPQRAVMTGTEGQFVMLVARDGKVVSRPVQTGGMSGSDFIIAAGLQGGEQVIVNGLQKARPGSTVKPVPAGQAGTPAAGK